ncbi:DegV family protein, partial [Mycobacterium senriense]|uniref:DegV family protein n=1 Tax=Mycobacterium senriense TaxID=2775496 RepID=UPI0039EFC3B6
MVTDSTCCLPNALIESFDITVLSQYFDVGGGASPEGGHELPGRGLRESEFDGDFEGFFAELDASKTVATTSPPTIEDFVVAYERLLQQHSAVVSVLISSSLNPTCSMAREAAARLNSEGRGERVVVIDSAG